MKVRILCLLWMMAGLVACTGGTEPAPSHDFNDNELAKQRLAGMVRHIYDEAKSATTADIVAYLLNFGSVSAEKNPEDRRYDIHLSVEGFGSIAGSVYPDLLPADEALSLTVYDSNSAIATVGIEQLPVYIAEQEVWIPTLVFRFADGSSVAWNTLLIDFYE